MTSLHKLAPDAEEVLDESMNGQESLRLTWRFEPSHLTLALPRGLMRDLGPIVLVTFRAMDDGRHDAPMRRRIASQLVGDQPPRHATLPLQQLAEESFGGFPITARLDEDIDHITVLIHRTPEVLTFALDRDEDLVQVPRVSQASLSALESTGVFRPEFDAPKSDRFIGNRDAALSQQILNISKAHAESVVEPDGVADDFGRKSISVVARRLAVCSMPKRSCTFST